MLRLDYLDTFSYKITDSSEPTIDAQIAIETKSVGKRISPDLWLCRL